MAENNHIIIPLHKPGLREKLFFLFSGVIVSIPITLFVDAFSRHLCFMLPVIYSVVCTSSIFVPFIEEFAKAFPLFYRHGETERSIFTLGFLTGLGFGSLKFFLYVLGSGASISVRLPGTNHPSLWLGNEIMEGTEQVQGAHQKIIRINKHIDS